MVELSEISVKIVIFVYIEIMKNVRFKRSTYFLYRYTPWDPNIHEEARQKMIKPKVNTGKHRCF